MRRDLAQNPVSRRQIGLFDPIQNAKPHPNGDCWTEVEGRWASLAQHVTDPRTNGKPGIAWRWIEVRGLHPRTPFADSKRPIPRPRNPPSCSGNPFGCKEEVHFVWERVMKPFISCVSRTQLPQLRKIITDEIVSSR